MTQTEVSARTLISCNVDPPTPASSLAILEHDRHADVEWNPNKLAFYQPPEHGQGKNLTLKQVQQGLCILNLLQILNANVLDFLLKNPDLLPPKLMIGPHGQRRDLYFFGTRYRYRGAACIRYLYRNGRGELCATWKPLHSIWLDTDYVALMG